MRTFSALTTAICLATSTFSTSGQTTEAAKPAEAKLQISGIALSDSPIFTNLENAKKGFLAFAPLEDLKLKFEKIDRCRKILATPEDTLPWADRIELSETRKALAATEQETAGKTRPTQEQWSSAHAALDKQFEILITDYVALSREGRAEFCQKIDAKATELNESKDTAQSLESKYFASLKATFTLLQIRDGVQALGEGVARQFQEIADGIGNK